MVVGLFLMCKGDIEETYAGECADEPASKVESSDVLSDCNFFLSEAEPFPEELQKSLASGEEKREEHSKNEMLEFFLPE